MPATGSFNLKREAAPVATLRAGFASPQISRFQSQTRSRPSCHPITRQRWMSRIVVSISNEKPPQLPRSSARRASVSVTMFQSQTRSRPSCHGPSGFTSRAPIPRFNLKREAAPVATSNLFDHRRVRCGFQSQTRSRPSCHFPVSDTCKRYLIVSISNEKPPQLPHQHRRPTSRDDFKFQSQTRSRPSCHAPESC